MANANVNAADATGMTLGFCEFQVVNVGNRHEIDRKMYRKLVENR